MVAGEKINKIQGTIETSVANLTTTITYGNQTLITYDILTNRVFVGTAHKRPQKRTPIESTTPLITYSVYVIMYSWQH